MKRQAVIASERAKQVLRPSAELREDIQNLENRATLRSRGDWPDWPSCARAYHAS